MSNGVKCLCKNCKPMISCKHLQDECKTKCFSVDFFLIMIFSNIYSDRKKELWRVLSRSSPRVKDEYKTKCVFGRFLFNSNLLQIFAVNRARNSGEHWAGRHPGSRMNVKRRIFGCSPPCSRLPANSPDFHHTKKEPFSLFQSSFLLKMNSEIHSFSLKFFRNWKENSFGCLLESIVTF